MKNTSLKSRIEEKRRPKKVFIRWHRSEEEMIVERTKNANVLKINGTGAGIMQRTLFA
jgi:hypothetical protein